MVENTLSNENDVVPRQETKTLSQVLAGTIKPRQGSHPSGVVGVHASHKYSEFIPPNHYTIQQKRFSTFHIYEVDPTEELRLVELVGLYPYDQRSFKLKMDNIKTDINSEGIETLSKDFVTALGNESKDAKKIFDDMIQNVAAAKDLPRYQDHIFRKVNKEADMNNLTLPYQ